MRTSRIYGAVILLAAVLAYVGTSQADAPFTLRSLTGNWGFSASGTVGGQPAAAVGLISFDGVGGCVESARLNTGGTVIPLTSIQCSYTVNADGTGSLNATFAGPAGPIGPFTADFVIVEGGEEFRFIASDGFNGGTVASGVAKQQT